MDIQGSRYSRDFGDPSVVIWTPLKVHGVSGASGTVLVLQRVKCKMQLKMGEYKVAKSVSSAARKRITASIQNASHLGLN